jgi:hypothetical protein
MRGGQLDAKSARRLMRSPEVLVLHAYGPDVTVLAGHERAVLLERVREFFHGNAPKFSVFELGELRDDQRRVMLAVQESC